MRIRMLAFLTMIFLSSCDRGILVKEKWTWDDQVWIQGDKKSLKMEAQDTTTVYALEVLVHHEETYPFQNLYVRTSTTYPSGKEVTSVVSLELLDDEGHWSGDMGENCCKVNLPLQERFTFPETGLFTWSIEPFMRTDTVAGIKSLTVTCRQVKE